MITRTFYQSKITAELVQVNPEGGTSLNQVEPIIIDGNISEKTAYKLLIKHRGLNPYVNIHVEKNGKTYGITEEDFMKHAKEITTKNA